MHCRSVCAGLAALWVLVLPGLLPAQSLPTIEEKTAGLLKQEGFFPLYWDAAEGRLWLEIPRLEEAFLYLVSLPAGLGSNDVGLDRGQLGETRVVRFERVGPKVLLVAPNLRYRADSPNDMERRAVRDAFAEGVVWGFTAAAETAGRVLVDATAFVLRDAHGITARLQETGQGSFRLDPARSALYLEATKAFPENTEMEARLTFAGEDPGPFVRAVAADPQAVTLRVRHSFVKLPPPGYEPRPFDPRSGFNSTGYVDYAAPIGTPIEKRFLVRHRLEKRNPEAAVSEAVAPIVYYLDPGTPEPVRSALLEGARWWAEAFEAAGFRGAFRVELLPPDADPMDVRYNTIQWVHRATRGWSYGSTVTDPRTGEIIKGHVTLGSLRVRQDYLIAEGLLAPYDGSGPEAGTPPRTDPMLEMALARIRQLAAHEVGHTLGLAHNFAASMNDRASVMDYPAPLAVVTAGGAVSLRDAYAAGIGAWDKLAIRYGYAHYAPGTDEQAALAQVLEEMQQRGLLYLTDADARPAGAAHPLANLWDNSGVLEGLAREMQVRRAALDRFGVGNLREGQPLALLEEVLVPIYLYHRYAVDAAAKLLGGVEYSYAVRGDARPLPQVVPAALQRSALDALLQTITPAALALPPRLRSQIPPRPPGYAETRELFDGYTGRVFDPYAPAEVAAGMVLSALIQPERAARLVYQEDLDPALPGLLEVLEQTTKQVWEADVPRSTPYEAELQRIVQQVWTDALLETAADPGLAPAVRARLLLHLRDLHTWLAENPGRRRDRETIAHRTLAYDQIDRFLFRLYRPGERREAPPTPPGSPIGQSEPDFLQRQRQRRDALSRWQPDYDRGGTDGAGL